jgi:hypothetical protein
LWTVAIEIFVFPFFPPVNDIVKGSYRLVPNNLAIKITVII